MGRATWPLCLIFSKHLDNIAYVQTSICFMDALSDIILHFEGSDGIFVLWVFFLQTSFDFVTSFLGGFFVPSATFCPKLKMKKKCHRQLVLKSRGLEFNTNFTVTYHLDSSQIVPTLLVLLQLFLCHHVPDNEDIKFAQDF